MSARRSLPLLGALAFVLYAAHAAWHATHGSAWDLFWACNAAMPLLVAGCFLGSGRLAAMSLMWLSFGTPMWILDLATGAAMIPTSPLVHVGGPLVGVLAARRLGWPQRTWLLAAGGTALLLGASRLLTPPAANVNLAFRVHDGWARVFPSHPVYVFTLWLSAALAFWVVEAGGRPIIVGLRARERRSDP